MNTKDLEDVIDSVLSPIGFRRRARTWYKINEDTISLLNLQKSQWGGQYYVNLGVYLSDLGRAKYPPEHQAHIRVRLSAITGEDTSALDAALDLERKEIGMKERHSVIARVVTAVAIPFLGERSTLPRLRQLHAGGRLGPVLITRETRALLEQQPA